MTYHNAKSLPPPRMVAPELVDTGKTITIDGNVYRVLTLTRIVNRKKE
ncbi:hypothetical protein [Caudoviricetes sp.]|nr:hypothetical protein [Caudoviricetes sp.]